MKKTLMLTGSLAALALGASAAFPATTQPVQYCSDPQAAINHHQTTTDAIVVPSGVGTIVDLNVYVDISHTYVGDLMISLEHNGTTTILVEQPVYFESDGYWNCSRPDIRATFDDEASLEAQYACDQSSTPAISGSVIGGNPPNSSLLAGYDGRDIGGTWTLTIDDRDDLDDGTLNSWCLIAEVSSLEQGPLAAECEGFAPPFDARIGLGKKEQRVIPLRMELFDENGFPLGLNDITAPTVSVSYSPGSNDGEIDPLTDSPGNATPGNSFRWDAATERWAFNLSTRPYTATGTYTVTAVAGDADYVLSPPCSNTFVRQ